LEEAIINALKAGDLAAVETFLSVMALRDPKRAEEIMDTLRTGLRIAREAR
jgi:hypothetical protein